MPTMRTRTPTTTSDRLLPQFIYQFHPGERPDLATDPGAWSEADEKIASDHFAYLSRGADNGVVILAGRAQDGIGPAIVIVQAGSHEAASEFMANDPFVKSGLFEARLHTYRVALWREPAGD